MIPQANPGAGYRALKPEIDAAVARALASGWYILGAEGRAFEAEFAAWLGAGHAVGCANGTDALCLALRALAIGPGSAVATVSHTAVATVAAIEMVGATPVLIDIDPLHYTIDPVELAEVLARPPAGLPPIRAVIAVHLYGQAADLDALLPLCAGHGVALIEDCAQAHGATWHGKRLGTIGAIGTFSLYPTKNLGALGDGGVVATNTAEHASAMAALRQYGWRQHYISDLAGVNSRLDEIQAAILRVKLPHLNAGNARRRAIAAAFDAAPAAPMCFTNMCCACPTVPRYRTSCAKPASARASTTRNPCTPSPPIAAGWRWGRRDAERAKPRRPSCSACRSTLN